MLTSREQKKLPNCCLPRIVQETIITKPKVTLIFTKGVQSVTNRILAEKGISMPVRTTLLGLLARLVRLLPPTLHPRLPSHLVASLTKEGDISLRFSLFAFIHALAIDDATKWLDTIAEEYRVEALGYVAQQCNAETVSLLHDKFTLLGGWEQCERQPSIATVQLIGLIGLRVKSARESCIEALQRAVYWREDEVCYTAISYLLDLLYLSDNNDRYDQCLSKLLRYFVRGTRYERIVAAIAYAILRRVISRMSLLSSEKLVS